VLFMPAAVAARRLRNPDRRRHADSGGIPGSELGT
jgi:hypothetical protein